MLITLIDSDDFCLELIIEEADCLTSDNTATEGCSTVFSDESEGASTVSNVSRSRLISKYSNAYKKTGLESTPKLSTRRQFSRYMEMVEEQNVPLEGLHFWQKYCNQLPTLYMLACRVLSVPASSAPVERIFSKGGILLRPHRARLASETLSMLLFLNCNENLCFK